MLTVMFTGAMWHAPHGPHGIYHMEYMSAQKDDMHQHDLLAASAAAIVFEMAAWSQTYTSCHKDLT